MATHSILENPMDREDWWSTVHRVTKSWAQLSMLAYRKVKVKVTQSCLTLCNPTDYTVYGILQAGVGSLSFLQEIFPTQGSNPQVSHIAGRFFTSGATTEAPKYWGGGAYPFSSRSSCINFLSLLKNYYYKLYVLKQCRLVIL